MIVIGRNIKVKMINKEKRGIYNVTFNEKKSTSIDTDLEAIENAIIDYVVHYVKGYHNPYRDRGLGAEHIKLHLESNSEGQIGLEELLNLGNSIREYLKNFKEPFIDEKGAKIYEWENKENIRFRVITDKISEDNLKKITEEYQRGGTQLPLSPSDEQIITFYSDRNLSQRMEFKNPRVKEYYEHLESQITQSKTLNDSIKIQDFNNQDSIEDRIALLEKNQQAIINTPKTNTIQEIEKQESTKSTDSSIKQQNIQKKLK